MSSRSEYRLVFSAQAERDIDAIHHYTLTTWGEQQLQTYSQLLARAFAAIRANPAIGRDAVEIAGNYKKRSVGQHVVFYKIEQQTISVVRVLHSRMDFARHLGQNSDLV